ncbi:phenylpropionate dioxygenase-like ring-hydroxylating dioxygenase large terminal subunit [Rhizobium sp. SG_E_25_P2]|uniref:aromatic ring-hydroxylating dioxygenase subunit alpha n=1 Tax=Rhizobium sp. SG_E_25_P2 TaxID=2879942 RepID=UPI0024762371|nr:aromatic ring-hydroxylating dioxygenase subunit alpha [Rhizobium sp. SG_E_25_P2]MDH6266280.1 phenylpropionate dioxygenase-like ring-hydroxylating dioxygenase large terminal subunit [Rhizobium sp. SG_E_25_P2]
MAKTTDQVALDDWYAIATASEVTEAPQTTKLLGQSLVYVLDAAGAPEVREMLDDGALGPPLPTRIRYGCLFTTLGAPQKDIVHIEEAEESDRRFVPCGWVTMRASGLRVVENFLDMAHFPFVHTDILGSEPHTEVPNYLSEIRRDVDEVWATNCTFFQPRIAATEAQGDFVRLTYRVPSPFVVMLYRVCPTSPNRLDAIALFIQPMEDGLCRAQPVMYLVDSLSTHKALLNFEQVIFLQDRIIVENQRPLLLPLEPRAEIPTRADSSSIAYRRWLKEKGLRYGTTAGGH